MNRLFALLFIVISVISCDSPYQGKKPESVDDQVKDSLRKMIAEEDEFIDSYYEDSIASLKIKKFRIKRISGSFSSYSPTVEYVSLQQMLQDIKKQAKIELWTAKKYKSEIESVKALHKGGNIFAYLQKSDESDDFLIVAQDKNGKELARTQVYQPSNVRYTTRSRVGPRTRYNSNRPVTYMTRSSSSYRPKKRKGMQSLVLEKPVEYPFYIYLIDKLEQRQIKYKVTPVYK